MAAFEEPVGQTNELAPAAHGPIHHYFGAKDAVLQRSVQLHRDNLFASESSPTKQPAFFSTSDHPG